MMFKRVIGGVFLARVDAFRKGYSFFRSLCLYHVWISMEGLKIDGNGLSLLWLRVVLLCVDAFLVFLMLLDLSLSRALGPSSLHFDGRTEDSW